MSTKIFYVLVCLECGDPERPLPMPFGDPAERGRWAADHTRGTGHDRWLVLDQEARESDRLTEAAELVREYERWRDASPAERLSPETGPEVQIDPDAWMARAVKVLARLLADEDNPFSGP